MGRGTQAERDQLCRFASILPGLALKTCPWKTLCPGQTESVGHSPTRASSSLLCPTDIVNKDAKSTLRVLYSLFSKHKLRESTDGMSCGSPN